MKSLNEFDPRYFENYEDSDFMSLSELSEIGALIRISEENSYQMDESRRRPNLFDDEL